MKVYVVEDYDEGITHAFDNAEKAKNYCLNRLIKYERDTIACMKENHDSIDSVYGELEQLLIDIETLDTCLYVEGMCHVYSLDLE